MPMKTPPKSNLDLPDVGDDDADTWGWGNDKDDGEPTRLVETAPASTTKTIPVNGLSKDNE